MDYKQKDNTGKLFVNNRKEKETHADRNGTALIDGVEYYMDAWINEPKGGGEKYLSIKFKRKDAAKGGSKPADKPVADADVPW